MILICISLMFCDMDHFSMYLLAIRMSFFGKISVQSLCLQEVFVGPFENCFFVVVEYNSAELWNVEPCWLSELGNLRGYP